MSTEEEFTAHLDVIELPADEECAVVIGGQATILLQMHEHDNGEPHVQVLLAGGVEAADLENVLAGLVRVLQRPDVKVQQETAAIINSAMEEQGN